MPTWSWIWMPPSSLGKTRIEGEKAYSFLRFLKHDKRQSCGYNYQIIQPSNSWTANEHKHLLRSFKSKFYMSWGHALNNVPCQGQVSILRSILSTHKHFHLNAMSSMSWHLSYWLHFNKETIWRIYSLLSLNQARVILFFYPSYYVFLAMELKLHFTFPVQEILQDPPHYRQGFIRQISMYTSGLAIVQTVE